MYKKLMEEHNDRMALDVKVLDPKCKPTKGYVGDSGWDVYTREGGTLMPFSTHAFPLGIKIIGKRGISYDVEDKSGLALQGLATGGNIIDSGYEGEAHAIVRNTTPFEIHVDQYQKIAQLVLRFISSSDTLNVHTESGNVITTSAASRVRGEGKFGSTGV